MNASADSVPFTITRIEGWTVVEFRTNSLMDPPELERISQALYRLVDDEDRRLFILDFSQVQYISSQAIGIVLTINKKLNTLPRSKFVLCGVGEKLMQLIKITRLDRLLTIKPTQKEALKTSLAL
ncbi:MAG TPA: STAS domain-containing protein [Tepidisphaeraceae bacterium]